MNKYFKISMFITSFIPLWITVLFIDIMAIFTEEKNLYTEKIGITVIIIALIFSTIIIIKSMENVKKTNNYETFKIIEATQEKGITSEFLLSYILPLFAFKFTEWQSVVQFLIYFCILMFLCVRNNNVYANLVLEFGKYKFYDCELLKKIENVPTKSIHVIVISRDNLPANKGNTIRIGRLNIPFYISEKLME